MRAPVQVEQMYSRADCARLLAVSEDTVDELVARGRRNGLWPVYRLGNRLLRIPESAIKRRLTACRLK